MTLGDSEVSELSVVNCEWLITTEEELEVAPYSQFTIHADRHQKKISYGKKLEMFFHKKRFWHSILKHKAEYQFIIT
jgi:hypothetical protein